MLKFANDVHRIRLCQLLARAHINVSDERTLALFYAIAGDSYLYERRDAIYNFVFQTPDFNCLYSGIIACGTQSWALLYLAFALYDTGMPADIDVVFSTFGNATIEIALETLRIRYAVTYPFI